MNGDTVIVPVSLPSGIKILVQMPKVRGEEDISAVDLAFESAARAIEGIATTLANTLERVNPHRASVEFELDFSVESGQLTALFVKGSGSGSLKVTLEWEHGGA
jgi:hypothetical protein